jgi:hypothetical protein
MIMPCGTKISLRETKKYEHRYMKLMQTCACCSFPTSTMLVKSLECQRYRAVISMGVDSGLAGPIFY